MPRQTLTPPFPWYGGKRLFAPTVWERFGHDVGVYVEPFAGSLAVLLHRETPAPREIVCDVDGGISNFWRAVQADPDEVAYWADWPTLHHDLTARHRYLVNWVVENADRLENDPDYFDAKAAGWWVWGLSIWIGGGWVQPGYRGGDSAPDRRPSVSGDGTSNQKASSVPERVPKVSPSSGGGAVSAQSNRRTTGPHERRPKVNGNPGGGGVSAQGLPPNKRPRVEDKGGGNAVSAQSTSRAAGWNVRPHVDARGGGQGVSAQTSRAKHSNRPRVNNRDAGGIGVSAQRKTSHVGDPIPKVCSWQGGTGVAVQRMRRPDLVDWFRRLQDRLYRVVVLNRDWQDALSPTLLQQTPTGPKPPVAIFLDPPYVTTDRDADIYKSDASGESDAVAKASFAWATGLINPARPELGTRGERYRIAYCCHEGDVVVPDGWTVETRAFSGIRDEARRQTQRDQSSKPFG